MECAFILKKKSSFHITPLLVLGKASCAAYSDTEVTSWIKMACRY